MKLLWSSELLWVKQVKNVTPLPGTEIGTTLNMLYRGMVIVEICGNST